MILSKLELKQQGAKYKLIVNNKETYLLSLTDVAEVMGDIGIKEEELAIGLRIISVGPHNTIVYGDLHKTFIYSKKE